MFAGHLGTGSLFGGTHPNNSPCCRLISWAACTLVFSREEFNGLSPGHPLILAADGVRCVRVPSAVNAASTAN
jgi:hypothetical protein